MPGPLDGIRIVDLTSMASGPLATAMLGDQGADVIKIEPPGQGDLLRHIGSKRGGVSAVFANVNRSKRSVVIDLRQSSGVELLRKLVRRADVFVQNFRPGVTERMGLGEETLRQENPGLIYVSISGFGTRGPDAQRKVYDSVMQAYAGFAAHQAHPETGVPEFVRNVVCDKSTALTTAQAVTAALFARERNGGGGQVLRISMLHASLAFLWPDAMQNYTYVQAAEDNAEAATGDPAPAESAMPRSTLPAIRRTADGYVSISTISDREFAAMCRALDQPALSTDPRFASAGTRAQNAGALHDVLNPLLRTRQTHDLLERLAREEVPHANVTMLEDLAVHPQIVANDLLLERDHPTLGRVRAPRPVGDFEQTPSTVSRLAPLLGEHTDEVLTEAGVPLAERMALRSAGVVA
jgi:crotonobetainyl-CoA:carnitine CoA-transferase CaiB-like acyl-CoA transferase